MPVITVPRRLRILESGALWGLLQAAKSLVNSDLTKFDLDLTPEKLIDARWARAVLHLWTFAICASVLTTWQHHFIDIPTGVLSLSHRSRHSIEERRMGLLRGEIED